MPFDKSRPTHITPQTLMACLLRREELEYALADDEEVYVAAAGSRWDNPEVTAMFADTIRRQKLLMATKMNFLTHTSFKLELQAIAAAKPEDFLHLQRYSTLGQAYVSTTDKATPRVASSCCRFIFLIPVVPHKAVAEVSRIGNILSGTYCDVVRCDVRCE